MADSQTKTHVPQAAIFQSDPTEQIFSKGILDRDMSGLSYMFLNAAQQRRDADQEEYMKGVNEANRINTALHSQELMSKQAIEVLKQAVEMSTKVGSPTDAMPIMRMLRPDGSSDPGAAAKLALILSEANANNAKASSEAGGKDQYTVLTDPQGTSTVQYQAKGRDAQVRAEAEARRIAEQRKAGGAYALRGTGAPPPGSSPLLDAMKQRLAGQ